MHEIILNRNINLEAWTWYYLTSIEFAQAARDAMQEFLKYYIEIAGLEDAWGTGRADQIAQAVARHVREYDAAIELMKHGDYYSIWEAGCSVRGTWSGISQSVLPLSWLDRDGNEEFGKQFGKASTFASAICRIYNNAYTAGQMAIDPDADPEIYNRDDGPIGADILLKLPSLKEHSGFDPAIPNPIPQYEVDYSRSCKTGETVPWTGVWYPETGLDRYSLAFAVKGQPMQPAYHLDQSSEEFDALVGEDYEGDDGGDTISAVPTTWHPFIATAQPAHVSANHGRLRGLPSEVVPQTGWWHTPALKGAQGFRYFEQGQRFPETRTTDYGGVIWGYDPDQQKDPPQK